MSSAEHLPGYRRRIRVKTCEGAALAVLEDDMHALAVTLRHDGERVTAVEAHIERMPWTTCPGARVQLERTFGGALLSEVTARREKKANCTHLHDLAVLAAAHAGDRAELFYEVFVSDPVEGARSIVLRRDGEMMFEWTEQDGKLVAPPEIAGQLLFSLRDWINALPGEATREAARVLQWASMVAHGRTIPFDQQSDATALPPSCYTFQPERAVQAVRNRNQRDFSSGSRRPLEGFGDRLIAELK